MKKNSKGFVLGETLFVSVVVVTILLTLYIQIKKINDNSSKSFLYNRTNDIMILESLAKYINETELLDSNFEYVDITDCTNAKLSSRSVCSYLVSISEIDRLIVSKNNMSQLKSDVKLLGYNNNFKDYILSLKNTYDSSGYRILAYFNNGTSANIVIRG